MQGGIQEFLWVAVPKISGAVLQLLFNLVLLRYFGPTQFGVLAVSLSVIILSDAVLGAAFDTAILRQAPLYLGEDPQRSLQVQQAGLLLKPLMGLVAAVPLVFLGGPLSGVLFQGRGSRLLLYLIAIAVLGMLILRSVQAHFQVTHQFRCYGISDLLNNTCRYGGSWLLLAFSRATPGRILGIYAAAPLVIAITLLATIARRIVFVPVSSRAIGEILNLIKSYLPTAAVGSITSRMDLLFVSSFASVTQAGIFAAAQTLILAPQMIGMYLGVVFAPRIMPLWKTRELAGIYNRFQKIAVMGSCFVYIAALVVMGRFVTWFMPVSFHSATAVALILLPAGLAGFVNFPRTVSLLLFTRPRFLLAFDLLALPVLVLLYVFVARAYGAAGAAVVTSAYALLKTAALQKAANNVVRQQPSKSVEGARLLEVELQPVGKLI